MSNSPSLRTLHLSQRVVDQLVVKHKHVEGKDGQWSYLAGWSNSDPTQITFYSLIDTDPG